MLIGYARVSKGEQSLNLQVDALKTKGCEKIFTDKVSGAKADRPQLQEALNYARRGDTLLVWKLDRFGRDHQDLIQKVKEMKDRGIFFQSLTEHIDTTGPSGKLQFHIFSALAEFGRDVIIERTQAGLRSTRARGRVGGRPSKMNRKKVEMAGQLMKDPKTPIKNVCELLGISKMTLYRFVSPDGTIRKMPKD